MKQTETLSDYQIQANEFAAKHGIELKVNGSNYRRYFPDDKECRYVFGCTLTRLHKQYSFTFGQSIASGNKEPNLYDVLACLQKSDPGTFENFCSEFGYDQFTWKDTPYSKAVKNIEANRTYKGVVKEWQGVERLFSDILDELQEIA